MESEEEEIRLVLILKKIQIIVVTRLTIAIMIRSIILTINFSILGTILGSIGFSQSFALCFFEADFQIGGFWNGDELHAELTVWDSSENIFCLPLPK